MITTTLDEGQAEGNALQAMELLRRAVTQLQPGIEWIGDVAPQLTMQQLRVMGILYNEGPTRVSTLAQRLNVSTPTVTGILDRLVQRGMTVREDDPADRRVVLNVLTDAGRKVIERMHPIQPTRFEEAVSRLSRHDQQALIEGLQVLLQVAGRG
jgi:DNA-binding MarR family transcriptional regulator